MGPLSEPQVLHPKTQQNPRNSSSVAGRRSLRDDKTPASARDRGAKSEETTNEIFFGRGSSFFNEMEKVMNGRIADAGFMKLLNEGSPDDFEGTTWEDYFPPFDHLKSVIETVLQTQPRSSTPSRLRHHKRISRIGGLAGGTAVLPPAATREPKSLHRDLALSAQSRSGRQSPSAPINTAPYTSEPGKTKSDRSNEEVEIESAISRYIFEGLGKDIDIENPRDVLIFSERLNMTARYLVEEEKPFPGLEEEQQQQQQQQQHLPWNQGPVPWKAASKHQMHYTISKDHTAGSDDQKAALFREFGQRIARPVIQARKVS